MKATHSTHIMLHCCGQGNGVKSLGVLEGQPHTIQHAPQTYPFISHRLSGTLSPAVHELNQAILLIYTKPELPTTSATHPLGNGRVLWKPVPKTQ